MDGKIKLGLAVFALAVVVSGFFMSVSLTQAIPGDQPADAQEIQVLAGVVADTTPHSFI